MQCSLLEFANDICTYGFTFPFSYYLAYNETNRLSFRFTDVSPILLAYNETIRLSLRFANVSPHILAYRVSFEKAYPEANCITIRGTHRLRIGFPCFCPNKWSHAFTAVGSYGFPLICDPDEYSVSITKVTCPVVGQRFFPYAFDGRPDSI